VIFVLIPTIVLAGCAMSPRLDAGFPWLVTLFGGRQSARTVHFIVAWLLVAFAVIHVAMVILSGPWNNVRSMITGRYVIQSDGVER
jgi:thiosulfate reductase cytochrome b subunit